MKAPRMPNRTLLVCLTALSFGVPGISCARSLEVAQTSSRCPAAWTEQSSADSLVAICLPQEFRAGSSRFSGAHTWKRPAPTPGDSDWVAVAILGDSTGHDTWPPPLASPPGCVSDCYTVESAVVHTDTLAASPVRLETGLVTGGTERAERAARLVGGWITPRRTRILLVGAAARPESLDTLRAALRTLRIGVP